MARRWRKPGYFRCPKHQRGRLTNREIHGLELKTDFLERDLRRQSLIKRDKDPTTAKILCAYCKREFSESLKPTIDHVIPLALGGKDDLDNLVLACRNCNRDKGRLRKEYFEAVELPITLAKIKRTPPPLSETEPVACVA